MKRVLTFSFAALLCLTLTAQDADFFLGNSDFKIQSTSDKESLWLSAKLWIANNISHPKDAIKMEDEGRGILVFNYAFPEFNTELKYISFTPSVILQLEIKDSLCVVSINRAICHPDLSQKTKRLLYSTTASYSVLTEAQDQIQCLLDLCKDEFSSSMDWDVINGYSGIRDKYKTMTEQLKIEKQTITKRREIKRIENQIEQTSTKYSILHDAFASYAVPAINLLDSLSSSLK